MKLKVYEIMPTISKSDKLTWENYIANYKRFSINLGKTNKNLVNQKKNPSLISKTKNFKKEITSKPDGVIDLHGYRLHTAKIILHNYIVDAYERKIRNILIIVNKGQLNQFKKILPEKNNLGISISYREQTKPRGLRMHLF